MSNAFHNSVIEQAPVGFVRHFAFCELVANRGFNIDLQGAKLQFEGLEPLDMQVLGIFAGQDEVFHWAWTQPQQLGEAVSGLANHLREQGSRPGMELFATPQLPAGQVPPFALGVACAGAAPEACFWCAPISIGYLLVIVLSPPLDLSRISPQTFDAALQQTALFCGGKLEALQAMASRLGYGLEQQGSAIVVQAGEQQFRVEMGGQAPPVAPEAPPAPSVAPSASQAAQAPSASQAAQAPSASQAAQASSVPQAPSVPSAPSAQAPPAPQAAQASQSAPAPSRASVPSDFPEGVEGLVERAVACLRSDDHAGAREALLAALDADPEAQRAHFLLAGLDAAEGNFEEAELRLLICAAQGPDAAVYRSLDRLYQQTGRAALALAARRRVLELDPDQFGYFIYGLELAKSNRTLEAAQMMEEAVPRTPQPITQMELHGRLSAMLGRRRQAIASFQQLQAAGVGEATREELERLLAIPSEGG